VNATRRKTLNALDLSTLAGTFEALADRAESAAQDWQYLNSLDALRRAVADADNEAGAAEGAEETVRAEADDEQGAYDGLPEGFQRAERGQAMEAAAEHLNGAADSLDEAGSYTRDAADALERLEALVADVLVDDETGRWILDDSEEIEGLFEEVKDALRFAADAVQAAADAVEEAVGC
jgi:hypothetical protein